MKKVLVLNRVEASTPTTCCNLFKKVDEFEHRNSEKLFLEKNITKKFNSIASQGFEFEDDKVFAHNLYIENLYKKTGHHGVYRFKKSANSNNYEFYFGPLIKLDEKEIGCGNNFGGLGCNSKNLNFKSLSCKSIGCNDKGGDNVQYLNFKNDEKNEDSVKILNKHFDLRTKYNKEIDDYLYQQNNTILISLSEYVKDNYEVINAQFEKDVTNMYNNGMKFCALIDVPSGSEMFSQGILFSDNGKSKIQLAPSSLEVNGFNLFLSRFDLWYFPKVKGLITQLIEIFFSKKEKKIKGTDIISENNLEKLSDMYEQEFNEQESLEEKYKQEVEQLKNSFVGKIPVTIAVKTKSSFFDKLFNGQRYNFYTYFANGINK